MDSLGGVVILLWLLSTLCFYSNFCDFEFTLFFPFLFPSELAKLDKTERRYAWIKRRLRTNEEIWKIFPPAWHVDYLLCIQFCKLTRFVVNNFALYLLCFDFEILFTYNFVRESSFFHLWNHVAKQLYLLLEENTLLVPVSHALF